MERLYKNATYSMLMIMSVMCGLVGKISITKFDLFRSAKASLCFAIVLFICCIPELLKIYSEKTKQRKGGN